MKIKIKTKDTEISIKGYHGSLMDIMSLYENIKKSPVHMTVPVIRAEDEKAKAELKEALDEQKETEFNIRERLPNNVVDVKQLDVKQAVIENALVRCPQCGQAYALIVKDGDKLILMRRNFDTNEFEIVAEANESQIEEIIASEGKYQEYFKLMQDSVVIDSSDFAVNNESEIFCPLCHLSDTFYHWKDAWENPLHFFEYEDVCDICGGEMSYSVSRDSKGKNPDKYIKVCNQCGRTKIS